LNCLKRSRANPASADFKSVPRYRSNPFAWQIRFRTNPAGADFKSVPLPRESLRVAAKAVLAYSSQLTTQAAAQRPLDNQQQLSNNLSCSAALSF
jgi:hypothetical protein